MNKNQKKSVRSQHKGDQSPKILINIISKAYCAGWFVLTGLILITTVCFVSNDMARNNRDIILNDYGKMALSAKLQNGLISATMSSVGEPTEENGGDPTTIIYTFDDGEQITVWRNNVVKGLQFRNIKAKLGSTLKGSDIKRRQEVTNDGTPYVSYKTLDEGFITLADGRVIVHDIIKQVTNPAINERIDDIYKEIRMSGKIAILSLICTIMMFVTLLIARATLLVDTKFKNFKKGQKPKVIVYEQPVEVHIVEDDKQGNGYPV